MVRESIKILLLQVHLSPEFSLAVDRMQQTINAIDVQTPANNDLEYFGLLRSMSSIVAVFFPSFDDLL